MKEMKGVAPVAIAVIIIVLVIAAVGIYFVTKPVAKEELPEERIKLTIVEPWAIGSERGMVIKGIIDKFTEENPDIEVEIMDKLPAMEELVTLTIAGRAPDIIAGWSADDVYKFAVSGLAVPLDNRIATWSPSLRADFAKPLWDLHVIGGQTYGVPWFAHTMALYYNKDMFVEAGIAEPPKTWDELLEAVKKLTKPGDVQYGIGLPALSGWDTGWTWMIFNYQNGGALMDPALKELWWNKPESVKSLEFYLELLKYAPPEAVTSHTGHVREQFLARRVAMYIVGPWDVPTIRKTDPTLNFGVAELWTGKTKATLLGGGSLFISPSCKNPDAAWKLIEHLVSYDMQMFIVNNPITFPFRIPARLSAMEDPWFGKNPEFKPFVVGMTYAKGFPQHKEYIKAHNNALIPELSNAILGKKTAEKALGDAVAFGKLFL